MGRVIRDKFSRKSKGFGFVSFMDFKDAAAALREMHGMATCYDWLVFDYYRVCVQARTVLLVLMLCCGAQFCMHANHWR